MEGDDASRTVSFRSIEKEGDIPVTVVHRHDMIDTTRFSEREGEIFISLYIKGTRVGHYGNKSWVLVYQEFDSNVPLDMLQRFIGEYDSPRNRRMRELMAKAKAEEDKK